MKNKLFFYFLLVLNLGIILFFWWNGSGALFKTGWDGSFLALGRLMGLLAVFFVLLQIVIISRTRFLEGTFGLDKLTRIHHLNGIYLLTFILAHPIFLAFGYGAADNFSFFKQLLDFIQNYEDVLPAAVSVIIFLFIVGYSIYMVRARVKYELWYFAHLLTYLAVALAFEHQLGLGGDFISSKIFGYYWYLLYAVSLGSLLAYRFVLPAWHFQKQKFYVKEIKPETKDVTSVYVGGNNLSQFKVKAGQFMILRFLQKGFWWQAHPFSLSISPNPDTLRFSIKNVGDFTSKINNLKPGIKVIIDGPYGIFTPDKSLKNKILLIAGGIGITPIRSLTEDLGKQGKKLILLYGNRTEQDTALKNELDDLAARYCFPIHYIMSNQPDYNGEKGRIDLEKIKRLVPDLNEREIYLCGPVPMMESLIKPLNDSGISLSLIHYEKFSL